MRRNYQDNLLRDVQALAAYAELDDDGLAQRGRLVEIRDTSQRLTSAALTFGYEPIGGALQQLNQAAEAAFDTHANSPSFLRMALRQLASALEQTTVQAKAADETIAADPDSESNQQSTENIHLFILEDDPSTSTMLKLGLASFGYRVSTFVALQALTEAAIKSHPDGLIIDTLHSSFADPSLAQAAKSMRENGMESIPIIIVSQHESFLEKLYAARNGVVAFLNKPVNIPVLESSLEQLLQHRVRSPYRILLVDDDPATLQHHRLMLEDWGLIAHGISAPENTLTAIEQLKPDLMIFELNMRDCTGMELAKVVRFHKHWIHIPIIFLSNAQNAHSEPRAMMTGGDDFLIKPLQPRQFISTVIGRAQRARQLAEMMTRDSLTGLLKHTEIKERLAHEFARAQRNRSVVSVAMLDIDTFKKVNDNYGHSTGDIVITTLAHLLRRGLRTTDIVGRYGGEEYLVILPDTDENNACIKINSLLQEFIAINFRHKEEQFNCSFSGGVCSSSNSTNIDALLEKADLALYKAKQNGRRQILKAQHD